MNSIWTADTNLKHFDCLNKNINTDTVIIGGGMAGVLTALSLKEKGVDCVIIEAREIFSGQTKNTTAKITSQHGLIYSKIEKYYGLSGAKQYARANQNAIIEYSKIIKNFNIDCDFKVCDAYLYSTGVNEPLTGEKLSAEKAGINCFLANDLNLPFKVTGALAFKGQAQFNPLKFVDGFLDRLTVYENTPAIRIEDNAVITPQAKVYAKNIVVACHYPFINYPSFYFLRLSSERSYALALANTGYNLKDMYIGIDDDNISLRGYNDLVLIGGGSHRTGTEPCTNHFEILHNKAKKLFPSCKEVARWSAQDCITLDGLPYIGKFSKSSDNIYVATGFNKWGMTGSMVSAKIISDQICNIYNENQDIFYPRRFNFSADIGNILTNTRETIKGFSSHLKPVKSKLDDLNIGQAREIVYNGHKAGAYMDSDGKKYIVSLTCPHLKCKLKWNCATKSWDCPCHGSRYNYKGDLIDNPAQAKSILIAIE